MTFFSEHLLVAVLRWTARALTIAILSLAVYGELIDFAGVPQLPVSLVNMFHWESPILAGELIIAIGLVIAWKWEGLGGILILGGAVFLDIVTYGLDVLEFVPLLLTALLFLCCWCRTPKRKEGRRIIAGVVLSILLVGSAAVLKPLRERAIGRDCEQLMSWVRSSHLAPGAHQLALPAQFQRLSVIDGKVHAIVLKDGRIVLLLKTSLNSQHGYYQGIVYCSGPLTDMIDEERQAIYILEPKMPPVEELLQCGIVKKVNDHLFFVVG